MEMSFRWYGKTDTIPLDYIRQIPGMEGIVTAIYDIPVGEAWPLDKIMELKTRLKRKVFVFLLLRVYLYTKILKSVFQLVINISKITKKHS